MKRTRYPKPGISGAIQKIFSVGDFYFWGGGFPVWGLVGNGLKKRPKRSGEQIVRGD